MYKSFVYFNKQNTILGHIQYGKLIIYLPHPIGPLTYIAYRVSRMREKQSDTFAKQRRHFISTAPATRLVHFTREHLIDGVPLRCFSLLCEIMLFLPWFLYFFLTGAQPLQRSIYRRMNPPSSLSNHNPFYLRRLEVSQTIEKIYVSTHFIYLVKWETNLFSLLSLRRQIGFCENFSKILGTAATNAHLFSNFLQS